MSHKSAFPQSVHGSCRRGFSCVAIVTLLGLLVSINTVFAQEARCKHGELSDYLTWVSSGAPAQDGPGVWAVDVVDNQIVRLGDGGQLRAGLAKTPGAVLQRPRQIQALPNGYLVLHLSRERKLNEIYRVDRNLEHPMLLPTQKILKESLGAELTAAFGFTSLVSDGELTGVYVFGDLLPLKTERGPAQLERATTALFFVNLKEGKAEIYTPDVDPHDEVVFNYLKDPSMRFLATLDGAAFMLFLDERPHIGLVRPGDKIIEELPDFPSNFRFFPKVASYEEYQKASTPPETVTKFLKILETTDMNIVAGLYSDDVAGRLFVLGRSPARESFGEADWWLVEIDPQSGKRKGSTLLPTHAAHLTVIPGVDSWTFINKDPVVSVGRFRGPYMRTNTMTLMPRTWMDSSDQPYGRVMISQPCDRLAQR